MPHIKLQEGLPGILGPMAFRPEMDAEAYRQQGARLAREGYIASTKELPATATAGAS